MKLSTLVYIAALVAVGADCASARSHNRRGSYRGGTMRVGVYLLLDTTVQEARKNASLYVTENRYYTALMNNVELIFRNVSSPKIKLAVVGIKKLTKEQERKVLHLTNTTHLDARLTLRRLAAVAQEFPSWSDEVLLLTMRDIVDTKHGDRVLTGYTYRGGVCTKRKVGIVNEDGVSFNYVGAMAQQIALALGATSDWGRSTVGCRPQDGYLLSNPLGELAKLDLSECSLYDLQIRYTSSPKRCWTDVLKPVYHDPSLLPAKLLKKTDVCRQIYYYHQGWHQCTESNEIPERSGNALLKNEKCKVCCFNDADKELRQAPAPDGTPCGRDKICIYPHCLPKTLAPTVSNNQDRRE